MHFAVPPTSSGGSHSAIGFLVVGIAFVLIGGLQVIKPDLNYRLTRWQYKNKQALEPSRAALIAARATGALIVVVGIVLLVLAATR